MMRNEESSPPVSWSIPSQEGLARVYHGWTWLDQKLVLSLVLQALQPSGSNHLRLALRDTGMSKFTSPLRDVR